MFTRHDRPTNSGNMDVTDMKMKELKTLGVLVVEDSPAALNMTTLVLEQFGVGRIFRARDGVEAQAIFEAEQAKIDLIVCDWKMPRMSGKEFLELVRRQDAHLPFIMVTAQDDLHSVMEAADSGVSAYITKPYEPKLLCKRIIDTLGSNGKHEPRIQPRSR